MAEDWVLRQGCWRAQVSPLLLVQSAPQQIHPALDVLCQKSAEEYTAFRDCDRWTAGSSVIPNRSCCFEAGPAEQASVEAALNHRIQQCL
jgi:hypothetical protein